MTQRNPNATQTQTHPLEECKEIEECKKGKKDKTDGIRFEIDERFRSCLEKWFKYKQEIKYPYKSRISEEACYKNLIDLSRNNPYIADKIINQSIAQGWKGLFQLKQTNSNNNGTEKYQSNFANNEDLFCGVIR